MGKRRLQKKKSHPKIKHSKKSSIKKSPSTTPKKSRPLSSSKTTKNKSNLQTLINNQSHKAPPPINSEDFFLGGFSSYYQKIISNTFDSYANSILERLLSDEQNEEKRNFISIEVLQKFGLTNELRKYSLKYLFETLSQYQIPTKFYFKSISIFDTFLIKYSEQNSVENCSKFFFSKHNKNEFSETKLVLFALCCFYLANQIHNTKNFDLKCLVNWNNKDELNYEELIDLVDEILIVIDCDTNKINLYDFVEVFLFDITKRLKILSKDESFLKLYHQNVYFFAMKFTQDITFLNILPSTQALGIFAFAFEYSKYEIKNLDKEISFFVEKWAKNVKNLLTNCRIDDIKNVIMWFNNYINTH